MMFDREPKLERWCWGEPLRGPSNSDRPLVLGVLRTQSGITDDRADESRRMEESDWALGEGEGAEGGVFARGKSQRLARVQDHR